MVVESILEGILSKFLDKMFYGITRSNIKAEVLKGRFVISNIGLRDTFFLASNMPYDLRHSYVQKIQLNIPWTSNQKVITINISKIYALLSAKQDLSLQKLDSIFMQIKKSAIKSYITQLLKQQQQPPKAEQEKEKKDGGISGFLKRLLDNVKININSIHLRFQDDVKKYSFGLRIQHIELLNVDQKQNPQFFNRQKNDQKYINYRLTIDPLQIYLNANQTNFLHKKDYAQITNQMISMDSYRRIDEPFPSMSGGLNQWGSKSFHNVLTISVKGILRRYIVRQNVMQSPQYECKITFKYIQSFMTDNQFQSLLSIVNKIAWYQGMLQHHTAEVQIVSHKQRQTKQIINLIRKPKTTKKQKQVVKKMAARHLGWVFKQSLLQVIKKKFIKQALKKQITPDNLFFNNKIINIIRKVPIFRLKQWIQICIQMRKRYTKQASIFSEKTKQLQKFYKKQLQRLRQLKQKRQQQFITLQLKQQIENDILLKLSVQINQLDIKISKNSTFGLRAQMQNTKVNILKRQNNFCISLAVEDLIVEVFKSSFGQKYPTYVPILRKNMQIQNKNNVKDLLKLDFQKSPIGKPFVFSQSKLDFQSIQITVYPEVLSKLYDVFLKQSQGETNETNLQTQTQQLKKKKSNVKAHQPVHQLVGTGFQYNIIQGYIQSPWIVIPLSNTNDTSKDCWVLRLGDLAIETPSIESSLKSDHKLFYQRYYIQLKSFELKYFSSVDCFHLWLSHGESIQSLKKLPGFKDSKSIDIIQPISCSVDLSIMKKHVSNLVRKTRESIIAQIRVQKVSIRLPKLLLDKLKLRTQVFQDQKRNQDFIEKNPKNILDDNTIEGLATISNEKFKGITFYVVLKGYFLYFFIKDSRQDLIFTTDIRDTTIRLTSDHHTYINEGKQKRLNILLKEKQNHSAWKKHLSQTISKRDRINDNAFTSLNSMRDANSSITKPAIGNKQPNIIQELSQSSVSFKDEDLQKIAEKQQSYLSLSFVMQSLQIQLIDEHQQDFLYCSFKKTKCRYSNLKEKMLIFSILQWKILESDKIKNKSQQKNSKRNIPFLSCVRLIKQIEKKSQNQSPNKGKQQQQNNFLQVKARYNYITGELNEIDIQVNQLYISWNIPIFNKILKFFFYKAQMADTPTAPSTQKKSLVVNLNMKRFFLYCFHDQQLIALLKLHYITINYSQNNIEQKYIVDCQKVEMDKYVDSIDKRVPMILCLKKMEYLKKKMKSVKTFEVEQNQSMKMEDSMLDNYYRQSHKTQLQQSEGLNPMYICYTVRKLKTEEFTNITRLKKQFGQDLLVSQLKYTWKDFIIYFDMEQTIRLIGYFINQILGTVVSKFKKRQFSINYISESLKFKKITTFDIVFTNFSAMLTPHSRIDHFFEIKVDKVDFTKNIRTDKPEYEPKLIKVPSQRNQISLFYDTMVFDITGISPWYKFKAYPAQKITNGPFNAIVTYSKLGFSRQYQPILNSLQDIDRTIRVKVQIVPGFTLQFQKIYFLTLMQIFYQNIKHRDGKAEKFETPHPHPALKVYEIDLGKVDLNMHEYIINEQDQKQLQNNLSKSYSQKNFALLNKMASQFQKIQTSSLKIIYKNQSVNSEMNLKIDDVYGFGELPVTKNLMGLPSSLSINLNSIDNQTFIKIVPNNLQLSVNLDKLNHIIQFTNFDSDFVSNKIMAKKKKDSYTTVNVFPEKCCAKIGQLELYGQFFISYTKDFKNPIDKPIINYLFGDSQKKQKNLDQGFIKQQVSDKQIKVNGQNISVFINKKHIGLLKRLYFGRLEYAAKQTLKRYRKQYVYIDGLSAMANILQLKQIYDIYEKYIKKAKDYKDKILLLPFQQVPVKPKSIQKRVMQVQFQRSYVNIMRMLPQKNQRSIPPFVSYLTIQFMIPKITYATYLKQQLISITDLSAKILQFGGNLNSNKIFQMHQFRLQYLQNKQQHSKYIQVQNAKNIKINIRNMNEKLLALLAKQILNIRKLKVIQQNRNSNRKIISESIISKNLSSPIRMHPLGSNNSIETEAQRLKPQQQFQLCFQNCTSRKMQVIINNFTLHSSWTHKNQNTSSFTIQPKGTKIFYLSGINLLQFVDQSAKQKMLKTEIGFRQDSHGPIVLKTMQQILFNGNVQLFSACTLKYSPISNGLKLSIVQPYSILNITMKSILVCMLDKNKNKLTQSWVLVEPGSEVNLNIQSAPHYIILQHHSNKNLLQSLKIQNFPHIRISQLPTNLNPNKIGPIHLYPSFIMQIMKWQLQNSKHSNRYQLVIFNRFRLQNNLPVSIESNFTIIQPFKQRIIQNGPQTCSINHKESEPKKLGLRIDQFHQISYDISNVIRYFEPFFSGNSTKAKKAQNQIKIYEIQYPTSIKQKLKYKIMVYCKIGYPPKNMTSDLSNEDNTNNTNWLKNQLKIRSSIQNFLINNQIVVSVSCSKVFKNGTSNLSGFRPNVGWLTSQNYEILKFKKDNDYIMLPQNIQGLYIERISNAQNGKIQKYMFEENNNEKISMNFWNQYVMSFQQRKTKNQTEYLYILEDICSIQNKTNHIMQAIFRNSQSQNNLKQMGYENKQIIIYPKQKVNIPILRKQENKYDFEQSIQIIAFCRDRKKYSTDHLACATRLQLHQRNQNKASNQNQQLSTIDMVYWSLNPINVHCSNLNKKYFTDIVKVTSKIFTFNQIKKYEFCLQNAQNNDLTQNQAISKCGYNFFNNLPNSYTLLVRQQNGIVPQQCQINKQFSKYYEQIDYDDEMAIPLDDSQDLLPSLKFSHKKLSNNIDQRLDEIKQKQQRYNKLEFSRENNLASSRNRIVQYMVEPGQNIWIGLTNLQLMNKRARTFIVQIYRTDCNLEYQQYFEVRIDQQLKESIEIFIKDASNKNRLINFDSSQYQSDQLNSVKSGKKALEVISKKNPNQINIPKQNQHKVSLYSHKKKDNSYEFFIESESLSKSMSQQEIQVFDYKRTTQVKIFEISLTIQVTNNPKDTLTLQLQNLVLNRIQLPPSSHAQQIDLKVDKLLIREDKNLPILKMLHENRLFLSLITNIEKVMMGNKFNILNIKLEPLQLNIREGILFKVLSRVVQIRNHYFTYGQKLDQSLNLSQRQAKQKKMLSMIVPSATANNNEIITKFESRLYDKFIRQRQQKFKKQSQKSMPKILLLNNFKLPQTNIYLSFSKDEYAQNKQQFVHDPIIKYFILIPAVSELKIGIPEIEVKQFEGTSKDLGKLVLKKIKHNIGGTVIRSLGSLNVLDNPVAAIDGVFQYLQAILMINSN